MCRVNSLGEMKVDEAGEEVEVEVEVELELEKRRLRGEHTVH